MDAEFKEMSWITGLSESLKMQYSYKDADGVRQDGVIQFVNGVYKADTPARLEAILAALNECSPSIRGHIQSIDALRAAALEKAYAEQARKRTMAHSGAFTSDQSVSREHREELVRAEAQNQGAIEPLPEAPATDGNVQVAQPAPPPATVANADRSGNNAAIALAAMFGKASKVQ